MTTTTPATPAPAEVVTPTAGGIARQSIGGTELQVYGDVNAQRAAAEATALVQSRYAMAMRNPRDWDDVRIRLMREVERPGFAQAAWFRKPIGTGVEGFSVRFAEAAARCIGNLMVDPQVTYEDEHKKVMRVVVTDLEANLTLGLDVTVEKTVERTSLGDGRVAISMRKNSGGKITYLVPATEDELLGKTNSLVSKARRNLILQILPGDIADEAKGRILKIRGGAAAKDPDAFRRQVVDGFAELNVMPSDLKRYLGHDIATASPAELTDLRDLFSSIKSGEATWAEVLAEKLGETGAGDGEAVAPPKPGLAGVTERLKQQGAAAATTTTTKDCPHTLVKAHLADQAIGTKAPCPECGEAEVLRDRQPGEDDEAPRVEDAKKTDKPRQGRLSEK